MRLHPLPGFRCALAFAVIVLAASVSQATIVVTPGASSVADDLGVRFRSFQPTGADEMYLGEPDLGQAANRVAQQFNWGSGPTTFNFTFDYTPGSDVITSTLAGGTPLNYSFQPDIAIEELQVTLASREASRGLDGLVWLTNLTVNGESVPDFTSSGSTGFLDFTLTNLPAATDLSITGTIYRTGTFSSSQELSRLEIRAGGTLVAIPEPSLVAVWALGAVGSVVASRRRRQEND